MEKFYEFAGVGIAVRIPEDRMYEDDRSLKPFRVGRLTNPHEFDFEVVDALPAATGVCIAADPSFVVYQDGQWTVRYIGAVQQSWDSAYICAAHRGREHRVFLKRSSFPDRIGAKTVLNCVMAEHLTVEGGGFILHSSYINRQGKGILFTAPSGTGKSTQAELWRRLRGAAVVNGDRSVVRITEEGIFACGIPFAGSSQICQNVTLPLEAIVYLKQAPQTAIRCLRGAESFRRIWEGVSVNTWDREDVARVSETVTKTVMSVPVLELSCTPDESAIAALEGELTK